MKRLYIALVARLLRALCSYCLRRGRYVDYVHHSERHEEFGGEEVRGKPCL